MALSPGTRLGPYEISAQIGVGGVAAALEAAHERGIVHRDLKPANVKIREVAEGDVMGRLKRLDSLTQERLINGG